MKSKKTLSSSNDASKRHNHFSNKNFKRHINLYKQAETGEVYNNQFETYRK